MSATAMGARKRGAANGRATSSKKPGSSLTPMVISAGMGAGSDHSLVHLDDSVRVPAMLTPRSRGSLREQVAEVLARLHPILHSRSAPQVVTLQTVFLRDERDREECAALLAAHYGDELPVTNYVLQPPCCGAALAMEVWAIGGPNVTVEHHGPQAMSVRYDGVRWIYCAGMSPQSHPPGVYDQTTEALVSLRETLKTADARFSEVVRTWFYLGGITDPERGTQRYKELNRARTDFYDGIQFCNGLMDGAHAAVYPASTGIGAQGRGLMISCVALQTMRKDARLLPLENPHQTPAYEYHARFSPKSPKFSRAMALVLGDYATTWVSGTASIVDSESCHLGDIDRQTEQTISNIENLVAAGNFAAHGQPGAGASLRDFAKIRVYVKRQEDFKRCQAICQARFGPVPAIYAQADVCRPELLVEIEGVAFCRVGRA